MDDLFELKLYSVKKAVSDMYEAVTSKYLTGIKSAVLFLISDFEYFWANRSKCSNEWGDLLNHLQSIILDIKKNDCYNMLNVRMMAALKCAVYVLPIIKLTEAELDHTLHTLLKAGIDPWKSIKKSENIVKIIVYDEIENKVEVIEVTHGESDIKGINSVAAMGKLCDCEWCRYLKMGCSTRRNC